MADSTDLQTVCQELLDASISVLDTIPLDDAQLDGSPERTFVSPGLPAQDCCDQLTVHASEVRALDTGAKPVTGRRTTGFINMVTLVVTISRCIHMPDEDGNAPDADVLQADAEQINADGWALWNGLWCLWQADQLFTLCGEVFWDGLRSMLPSGGCAGWTLTLRTSLDGYCDVPSS